jgi:hypothetical protein
MEVLVNAGGPASTVKSVRCRVDDGGEWQELKQTGRYAWTAAGVGTGAPGRHVLQVEARTPGDKTWTATVRVTVEAEPGPLPVKTAEPWTGLGGNSANTCDVGATGKPPLRLAWCRNVGAPVMLGGLVVENGKVHVLLARYALEQRAGIVTLSAAGGKEVLFHDLSDLDVNRLTTHWLQYDRGVLYAVYPYSSTGWAEGYRFMAAVEEGSGERLWAGNTPQFTGLKMCGDLILGRTQSAAQVDGKRVPSVHVRALDGRTRKAAWTSEALYAEPGSWDVEFNGYEVPAVDENAKRVYTPLGCVSLADGTTVWKQERDRHFLPWLWVPTVCPSL